MHFTAGQPFRALADVSDANVWMCLPGHPPYVCPGTGVQFYVDGAPAGAFLPPDPNNFDLWELHLPAGLIVGLHTITASYTPEDSSGAPGVPVWTTAGVTVRVDPAPSRTNTVSLSSDIVLSGSAGLTWDDATIYGNGHTVTGSTSGGVSITNCVLYGLGSYGTSGIAVTAGGVTLDGTIFEATGAIALAVNGSGAFTVTNNEFRANNLLSYVAANPDVPVLLSLNGTTSGLKRLSGNRIGGGIVELDNTAGWQIGGLTDAESNIFIGNRALLNLRNVTNSRIQGNYIHHDYLGGFSQGFNLEAWNPSGLLAEHNILRGGSWVVQGFGGDFRYNLVIDEGDHDAMRTLQSNTTIHHNVFQEPAVPGATANGSVLTYSGESGVSVYNNTFDYGDAAANYRAPAILAGAGATWSTISSNLFTHYAETAGGALVAGDGVVSTADYNAFWNPLQGATLHYKAGFVQTAPGGHDVTSDPTLTDSTPSAYAVNEGAIWNRTLTVSQVLTSYRARYAPRTGSPLIDTGDPAFGSGNDIGAVGAGAANSFDLFGTFGSGTAPPTLPTITLFTATPSDYDSATWILAWAVSSATNLTIDQGVGNVTGLPEIAVVPLVTTTYTLTASNAAGSTSASVTITIVPAGTLAAHPRIWLDPVTLVALKTRAGQGDPGWLAIKAAADAYLLDSVPPFDRYACGSNQICYTYQGSGWWDAWETLGLAYQITGNTAYADQAIALMGVANATFAAGNLEPITADSGYPSRFAAAGLALAFDWCYDRLDVKTKAETSATLNAWFDWVKVNAWEKDGPVTGNYFGGHVLGFGLAGLTTTGDNARGPEITAYIRSLFDANVPPAFASSGLFAGGYPYEGYVYSANHFMRLFQYVQAVKSATGEDLSSTYAKPIAANLLYALKPNRWRVMDEGDYPGSYSGILSRDFPLFFSQVLAGTQEGAELQWLYDHLASAPDSSWSQPLSPMTQFMDGGVRPSSDYRLTRPLSFHSPGDDHLFTRTSWADDAVWASFMGGSLSTGGHQLHSAGHIAIQRGDDYLLVNAGQWKGPDGWGGDPQADDNQSWRANTLWYPTTWTGGYTGGQGYWGVNHVLAVESSPTFAYMKADVSSPYINTINTGLQTYVRSFVSLMDGTFAVYDRIVGPSPEKKLLWHVNPRGVPQVSGNVVTSTVGASTLTMTTLLPASASLVTAADPVSDTDPTPSTYRVEVVDPSGAASMPVLTVFSALASTTAAPVPELLASSDGGMVGTVAGANVVLFSRDGTARSSVSYTLGTSAVAVSSPTRLTRQSMSVAGGQGRGKNKNKAPVVNAGPDQTITLPVNSVTLSGTATDDGLPNPPGRLTYAWTGSASFSAPTALSTTATFSAAGSYVLRLTASDSVLSASDTLTVTVNPETVPPPPPSGTVRHLLLDMAPGVYRVFQNGVLIGSVTASAQGVLSFASVGGGTFLIQ